MTLKPYDGNDKTLYEIIKNNKYFVEMSIINQEGNEKWHLKSTGMYTFSCLI